LSTLLDLSAAIQASRTEPIRETSPSRTAIGVFMLLLTLSIQRQTNAG